MANALTVEVFADGDTVKCNPPRVTLRPGQSIIWVGPSTILLDFGDKSPFEGSRFRNGDTATVRDDAPAGTYTPTITVDSKAVSKTVGGVEVDHPNP
jgi:hypothetical protein